MLEDTLMNRKNANGKKFLSYRKLLLTFLGIIVMLGISGCQNKLGEKIQQPQPLYLVDSVHDNPGEKPFNSQFKKPAYLKSLNYDALSVLDFKFLQTAATFEQFDKAIFPQGSPERMWVEGRIDEINNYILECKKAGIACYISTDLMVLPKRIKTLYGERVLDEHGRYSINKPLVKELHRIMFREVFTRFPELDGVIVRTGETYVQNIPYHDGNGPTDPSMSADEIVAAHIELLKILREEVAVRFGKTVIYRTWSFGEIHTDPALYLAMTDAIEPHKNLIFSIKHTKGDFLRNFDFNPTIGIGKHKYIVEVQAQREYEGKGSHPNYIADGVINGFEELQGRVGHKSLTDLIEDPKFSGLYTWSRGGGWKGPYISNELWSELNIYVLANWVKNPTRTESDIFDQFSKNILGLDEQSAKNFRRLNILSAQGVLRGHSSLITEVGPWWIRDEFMGGIFPADSQINMNHERWGRLNQTFDGIIDKGLVDAMIAEKGQAAKIWQEIEDLSKAINGTNAQDIDYIKVSSSYGRIKYSIIHQAWVAMLKGYVGDKTGHYDIKTMRAAITQYDLLWQEFTALKEQHPQSATLYKPYAFIYEGPDYYGKYGMQHTIDRYRKVAFD